jgi:hypothetical protein
MSPPHLILVPIVPLLFLVSHNINIISLPDVVLPFVALVGMAVVFWVIISALSKSKVKAALIVSWFYLLFFSYGHVHGFLNYVFGSDISETAVKNRYLIPVWSVLILYGSFWVIKTKKTLDGLAKFVNVWAIVMVAISAFNISIYLITEGVSLEKPHIPDLESKGNNSSRQEVPPDIYYIIFDAYANEHTLKETFGYDNSPFINFLKKRGFFVASESRANYAETNLSLGSSLNMDYWDEKVIAEKGANNPTYALNMLENNKVVHMLKQRGYKFVHFAAGWGGGYKNRNADLEVKCDQMSEMVSVLVEASLYFPFEKHLKLIGNDRRQQILCTFDRLGEIAHVPGPKFVFGDVMVPHFKYDFGRNGEYVEHDGSKEGYLNQLIFTTKKIMNMVDKILEQSSSPPIIILQSDHGPTVPYLKTNPEKPDNDYQFKKDRLKNLNAYLLPGKDHKMVYQTISPVNSFRVIFNLYFEADYKLLEDRSYFSWYPDDSYQLEEIDPYGRSGQGEPLSGPQ